MKEKVKRGLMESKGKEGEKDIGRERREISKG